MSPPAEHAGPSPGRSQERPALAALCITQATSWGVLFYAFAVLLPRIEDAPEWSASEAAACFSGGLLVSAAAGLGVGRWIDRHSPREVMTGGSLIGAAAILGVAGAPNLAAFAALTRWYGDRRVWTLTVLTLAAGLSSFLFAPLTALLATPSAGAGPSSRLPVCSRPSPFRCTGGAYARPGRTSPRLPTAPPDPCRQNAGCSWPSVRR